MRRGELETADIRLNGRSLSGMTVIPSHHQKSENLERSWMMRIRWSIEDPNSVERLDVESFSRAVWSDFICSAFQQLVAMVHLNWLLSCGSGEDQRIRRYKAMGEIFTVNEPSASLEDAPTAVEEENIIQFFLPGFCC